MPQTTYRLSEIPGQQIPVRMMRAMLETESCPSALLISGISGVEKMSAATAFAMAANCLDPCKNSFDACGECRICNKIKANTHPDMIHVAPIGNSIKINQIRHLCDQLTMRPYEAKKRFVFIKDADEMTTGASNALLKVLEEPPAGTHFIIIASRLRSLLATIRSRCQIIRFRPIPVETLAKTLQSAHGVDENTALTAASIAQGSIVTALSIIKENQLPRRNWLMKQLSDIFNGSTRAALLLADILSSDKTALQSFLSMMQQHLRDILAAGNSSVPLYHPDSRSWCESITQTIHPDLIMRALIETQETQRAISQNAVSRLALETLFLKMAKDTYVN